MLNKKNWKHKPFKEYLPFKEKTVRDILIIHLLAQYKLPTQKCKIQRE